MVDKMDTIILKGYGMASIPVSTSAKGKLRIGTDMPLFNR